MERKLVLVFFVMFYQTDSAESQSQNVTCGAHEVAVKCPKVCPTDYCPISEKQNQTCPEQRCDQNSTGCQCAFDYRRAKNGTCIKTEDCPPFRCSGPNERYVACPAYCPSDSCADARLQGRCPFMILVRLECFPKCQCKQGYARNNGTCVPTFLCPGQEARLCLCRANPKTALPRYSP